MSEPASITTVIAGGLPKTVDIPLVSATLQEPIESTRKAFEAPSPLELPRPIERFPSPRQEVARQTSQNRAPCQHTTIE